MQKIIEELRRRLGGDAPIAVILGSGVKSLAQRIDVQGRCSFDDVEGMPRASVQGHAGEFIRGQLGQKNVILQCGRVHFYEGYPMAQVIYPTRLLYHLGVRHLIITNAAGGIKDGLGPGSLMAIEDHINYLGESVLRGGALPELESPFADMSQVYDREAIERSKERAQALGIALDRGVYIAFPGPSFETPAEIRMARTLGADAVGMSTVPEATAANALGMKVSGFSLITNKGAGLGEETLTHDQTLRESQKAEPRLSQLIEDLVGHLD